MRGSLPLLLLFGCSPDAASPDRREQGQPPKTADFSVEGTPEARLIAEDYAVCELGADRLLRCAGALEPAPEGPFRDADIGRYGGGCAITTSARLTCWGDYTEWVAAPDVAVSAVAVGGSFACTLNPDGAMDCWGGPGTPDPLPGVWVDLDADEDVVCGRSAEGLVACSAPWELPEQALVTLSMGGGAACGVDERGRGHCWAGSDAVQTVPDGPWRSVIPGPRHACGVDLDGNQGCWGDTLPPGELPDRRWVSALGSLVQRCALDEEGTTWCDSLHDSGQTDPPAGAFVALAVGADTSCALSAEGALTCWGVDYDGLQDAQLGTGWTEVSVGDGQACVGRPDGTFRCLGGTLPPAGLTGWGVAAAGTHACILDDEGFPTCWGLGLGVFPAHSPDARLDALALGRDTTCGVVQGAGSVRCWSAFWEDLGQLEVAGSFRSAAASLFGTCGVEGGTGELVCVGEGALADDAPTGGFQDVDLDGTTACGLREDGTLTCWGTDVYGEGRPPGGQFADVAVGRYHGCALDPDGVIHCWGIDDRPFE